MSSHRQTLVRAVRGSPWIAIAAFAHVIALLATGAVPVEARTRTPRDQALSVSVREKLTAKDESWEPAPVAIIDRNAIPRNREGSIDLDEVIVPENEQGEYADGRPSAFVSRGAGGGAGAGGSARPRTTPAPDERPPETWKRSSLIPNSTRLRVGETETLPLDAVEASIRIDGTRARVVLDCLYRNDRDCPLEGTFELRLPNEASPFYFAFGECVRTAAPISADVPSMFLGTAASTLVANAQRGVPTPAAVNWTEPKEARMVPRERAAWAYREWTQQRADPALVEWSGAGVFSTRVWPLAAGRTHRIVFAYDVDLTPATGGDEFRFGVPPGAAHCSVTVNAESAARATVTPAAQRADEDGRSTWSFRDPAASEIVVQTANARSAMLVGDDAAVGSCFAVSVRPQIPASITAAGAPRAVFLVDTSLSSNPERFTVWLKLLRALLDENRASIREFGVLFFDVSPRWWRNAFVPNTKENCEALLADAGQLSLAGATDLAAALAEASFPSWSKSAPVRKRHDLFLLTDGATTWGTASMAELDSAIARERCGALWAYETGLAGTDSATLAHLTGATGGAVFSVTGESEIAAAATAHRVKPCRLRGVTIEGGSDVLVAGRPAAVHPGQTLRIAGRGAPASGTAVVLALEQDGREFELRAMPSRVVRSDLAPRAYGRIAVGRLEELGDVSGSPVRSYATHFRVVGSTCSLLMLEQEADYARFGIVAAEEAVRVRAEPVTAFAARFDESRGPAPDARSELLAFLNRLAAMPGMSFRAPDELVSAIGRMPPSSFRAAAAPLALKSLRRSDVPDALEAELASHDLDYLHVRAEADRLAAAGCPGDALRTMSSLVENRPGDTALARDVAASAVDWGLAAHAVPLLRRVVSLRPNEPETYRSLADALQRAGDVDLAIVWSEVAIAANFDRRFGEFRSVATLDYVRLLKRIARGELKTSMPGFAAARLSEVTKQSPVADGSLVVIISWNTDRTDVDLHVTDPRGETCGYDHQVTALGGSITRDVTQGYGPEMFRVAHPAPGEYAVRVHYYSSDQQRASVRSQVVATIYERCGAPDEQVTRKVVDLTSGRTDSLTVATIYVPEAKR